MLKEKRWKRLCQLRDLPIVKREDRDLPTLLDERSMQRLPSAQREREEEDPLDSNSFNLELSEDNESIRDAFQRMDDALEEEIQEIQAMTPIQRTRSGRRVQHPDRLITTILSQTKPFLGENVASYTDIGRQRVRQYVLDDMFLHELDWTCLEDSSKISTISIFLMMVAMHQTMDYEVHTFEEWNPMILSTVAKAQDNPS